MNWINANSPVDAGLNIDADVDGYVDNVCFMIKGNSGGWSELLWAHRWSLFSQTVKINNKRVLDYTFQPESQLSVNTLCHEMFHALGAPDLYHYDENVFAPVGGWDIMESGRGHMGAYMKWKYADAKWITSIPEITTSGTYSLNPLTSSTNNCYKIASPNSTSEFFVLEYRSQTGSFEVNLPGSGLLVYRINTDFEGNANFDNVNTFDEVYIYRPGGTTQSNGTPLDAHLTYDVGRTSINDVTDPKSFLHNGLPGGLNISNVSTAGANISFNVYISAVKTPQNFAAIGVSETQVNLSWNLNTDNNDVIIAYSTTGAIGSPVKGTNYSIGSTVLGGGTVIYSGNATTFSHTSLSAGTNYYYRIWSKNSSNEYSAGVTVKGGTNCVVPTIPLIHGFNGDDISPCWTVELVAQGTVERAAAAITQVKFSANPDATPNEGSHMIKFNSMDCGVGNKIRLSSPAFSTTGQSQLYVNFAWNTGDEAPELDNMKVQWSTDGTNWIDGTTYQRYSSNRGWTQQSYKLPDAALNQSNLKIGFLFTSQYGYNCYLDNLKIETTSNVGVESNNLENIMIFPNPTKGVFKVKTERFSSNMRIDVHDVCGKLVYSRNFNNSNENIIELTNQSKGLYILTIYADDKILNHKVLVE